MSIAADKSTLPTPDAPPAEAGVQPAPESATSAPAGTLTSPLEIELPENLMRVVDVRLGLWHQILKLEEQRKELSRLPSDRDTRAELARQRMELKRIPTGDALRDARTRLESRLHPPAAAPAAADEEATADEPEVEEDDLDFDEDDELDLDSLAGDSYLDEMMADDDDSDDDEVDADEEDTDEDEEPPAEAAADESPESAEPPPPPVSDGPTPKDVLKALLKIGIKQNELLSAREQLDGVVPKAAEPLAREEPLAALGRTHQLNSLPLLAWTYYALGVEKRLAGIRGQETAHEQAVRDSQKERKPSGGLMGKFRNDSKSAEGAPQLDPQVPLGREAAERELRAIEPMLNDQFWALAEEISWLYAAGRLAGEEAVTARTLLRFGMVARHPALLAPDKTEYIITNCREDVYEWSDDLKVTHIVYVDEYLRAIYDRKTTVSPDEELELNGRGSDEWKADRMWRRAVASQMKLAGYEAKRLELTRNIEKLSAECEKVEARFEKARRMRSKQVEAAKAKQRMLAVQTLLARNKQNLEKLEEKYIPEMEEAGSEAREKLDEFEHVLGPEQVIRREAAFVRRLVRLAGRLKTPYPHFVLRDQFEPDRTSFHNRDAIRQQVTAVEYADRYLFHEVLVPHAKPDRRLTVRFSPVFIIVPGCGTLGLCLTPRRNNDAGKIMLPLLGKRSDLLPKLVLETMADFSWDCSREQAGADWITADALCSAYASVRWSYRTRPLRVQKKAGFNKKGKDRIDWRGHYALFVSSVKEAGRKLFFACPEVYDVIVKYMGLPKGIERLRRD